jgi:hypothetical protein
VEKLNERAEEIADLKLREANLLKELQEKERKNANWKARADKVKGIMIELKKSMNPSIVK